MSLATALDALEAHLRRYVYFGTDHDAVAVSLYCAGTHAFEAAETFPILAFMSPVRRSGKTRAMDTIQHVVARPWRVIRPSESVLFRKLDRDRPTLMLDEVDTIWSEKNEHEGLRSILNAGNRKGTTVARTVVQGKTFDLVDFSVYSPKVLAGIGTLPETVRDRAIVISMVRKGQGDTVERLRSRKAAELGEPIGIVLGEFLSDIDDLTLTDGELPESLDDRAQDGWEPLLAIAKRAGGEWPARARAAAVALSSSRDDVDDESLGIVLLRDIRTALTPIGTLTTSQLIEALCAIELSPWGDMYGKPITGRRLSKLLRPFGIHPERERAGSRYHFGQFVDSWSRYIPRESAGTAATATSTHESPVADAPSEPLATATASPRTVTAEPIHEGPVAVVAVVAANPGMGGADRPPRLCPACRGLHPVGTVCPVDLDGWPPRDAIDDDPPTAWTEVMS